nr:hypothetical protein [Polymorphobacter sp.]
MRVGFRALTGAALGLALFAGDISTLSLMPSAAMAQRGGGGGFHGGGGFGGYHGGGGGFHGGGGFGGGYHGGGFGGYRGGYGGYRGGYGYRGYGGFGYGGYYGGYGFDDFLLGAALVGGTAAIIASNDRPVYDTYPVYEAPPPVYDPGYAPPGAYAPPAGYAPLAPPPQQYASNDPVAQCSSAAVGEANSNGDSGRVLSVDQVVPHENGARVIGTLEVFKRNQSTERARFTCTADYGHVTSFRFG